MALNAGSITADSGMSKAIYDALDEKLKGFFDKPEVLEAARNGWRTLSFCIADGVVSHLKANMEIKGIVAAGNLEGKPVQVTQNNDGTGHVN